MTEPDTRILRHAAQEAIPFFSELFSGISEEQCEGSADVTLKLIESLYNMQEVENMKTAVIYKSHYGSTKTYAKWIAEDLDADLLQADQVKPHALQQYDIIVYGGGIYVGSVSGLAFLTKNAATIQKKELYLFTVGAADVNDPETPKTIRSNLKQKLPPELWERAHLYHLRGGMQYSKMSFLHRCMMGMMIKMLQKKPQSALLESDKYMLETYGLDVVVADRMAIVPLVADIQSNRSCTPTPQ